MISELDPERYERFEEYAGAALESLPSDLRQSLSNVEIVIEDEPPPGQRLLGLYQGVPLTRRGSFYPVCFQTRSRSFVVRLSAATDTMSRSFARRYGALSSMRSRTTLESATSG